MADDARSKVKQNLVLDLDKYREFRTWRTTLLQAQKSRAKAKFDQFSTRKEGSTKSPEGLKELKTIREAKRQVVRRQKEILDSNHRKIKVFQYLKPVLIQQYKQDFIEKNVLRRRQRKLVMVYSQVIALVKVAKALSVHFKRRKQEHMAKLRLVWISIATTVRMKRRLRRHGPSFESRLHRKITMSFLLQHQVTSSQHLERAKSLICSLLHGRSKRRQF